MIIVRHGQTELNVYQGFQGHTDFPLTDEGIAQVKRNIERYEQPFERAKTWLEANYAVDRLVVCHRSFDKIMRGAYLNLTSGEIMATDFLHEDILELK